MMLGLISKSICLPVFKRTALSQRHFASVQLKQVEKPLNFIRQSKGLL